MIKDRVSVLLLVILALSGWTGCSLDAEGNRAVGGPGFGHASIYTKGIGMYLSNRELSPIEGVWVWENNEYEAAIIRNTSEYYKDYDYLGVITNTRNSNWSRGQIKLVLKETSSPQAFSGMYLSEYSEIGTMFLASSPNLIEFNVPFGPYETPQRVMLVRNFPKESRSSHSVDTENSSGTGFFVTQDVVATNYHVVREAKSISLSVGGVVVQADLL